MSEDLIWVYEDPSTGKTGKLFQGAWYDVARLTDTAYDPAIHCIVLAASGYQNVGPLGGCYDIIKAPFDDAMGLSDGDRAEIYDITNSVSNQVYSKIKNGKNVLITCQAGLNRSGLISARVLMKFGFSAKDAIEIVRKGRGKYALCNPEFVEMLKALPPQKIS